MRIGKLAKQFGLSRGTQLHEGAQGEPWIEKAGVRQDVSEGGRTMSPHIQLDREVLAEFCQKWKVRELSLFGSALRDDFAPERGLEIIGEVKSPEASRPYRGTFGRSGRQFRVRAKYFKRRLWTRRRRFSTSPVAGIWPPAMLRWPPPVPRRLTTRFMR